MGVARLMGMICERISSLGALMLMAMPSLRQPGWAICSQRRARPSALPTVLTMMLVMGTHAPLWSVRMAIDSITASTLSSGSPMPMKTMFLTVACRSWVAANHWPTISGAVSERTSPIWAVSQKPHPMAQPTWLETHSVWLFTPRRPIMGIWTHSMS